MGSIEFTKRLLEADHPLIRIAAIRALARAGETEAIRKGLADGDPVVRASAVFWEANTSAMPDVLAAPAVAALLEADDDDSDTVRRIVIEAIRDDGGPRWKGVLLELAKKSDPSLIQSLARAVERVPDPRFVPFLVGHLATRAGRSDVRAALMHTRLPKRARVLDVATGGGHTGLLLASLGHDVTLSDITQAMLDRASETARERGLSVKTRLHEAESFPYPDASFDLVTCRVAGPAPRISIATSSAAP